MAYDQTPPFGGPHDSTWANCTGTVYADAIRTENAVHSLEHGAIWITYNPDLVDQDQIDSLAARVNGKSYMLMSPYLARAAPSRSSRGAIASRSTTPTTSASTSSSPR